MSEVEREQLNCRSDLSWHTQADYLTVPLSSRRAAGVLGHDFKKMGFRTDQVDHDTYAACPVTSPQRFHLVSAPSQNWELGCSTDLGLLRCTSRSATTPTPHHPWRPRSAYTWSARPQVTRSKAGAPGLTLPGASAHPAALSATAHSRLAQSESCDAHWSCLRRSA